MYEGGQRLHPAAGSGVLWLELALRQHEICWRAPRLPGEKRIALFGNSAIFGFPHPVELSFGARLNGRFDSNEIPAHVFNLGWIFTYMLRDALILHEALSYEPDLIVYPLTLDDFTHSAPALFPEQLVYFFERNVDALAELAGESQPGLVEPLELYQPVIEKHQRFGRQWFAHLREAGAFARLSARRHATTLAAHWAELPPPVPPVTRPRKTEYDCAKTIERVERHLTNWSQWHVLGYLERIRDERKIEVLVVNWPNSSSPIDECYNARYTKAVEEEFNHWMSQQTRARGLRYLDLHDLLEPQHFVDSLHLTPEGHAQVADAVATALLPMLDEGP